MFHKLLLLLSFFVFLFIFNSSVFAQESLIPPKEERLEAVVSKMIEEKEIELNEKNSSIKNSNF